jgi:hypothetical protein
MPKPPETPPNPVEPPGKAIVELLPTLLPDHAGPPETPPGEAISDLVRTLPVAAAPPELPPSPIEPGVISAQVHELLGLTPGEPPEVPPSPIGPGGISEFVHTFVPPGEPPGAPDFVHTGLHDWLI